VRIGNCTASLFHCTLFCVASLSLLSLPLNSLISFGGSKVQKTVFHVTSQPPPPPHPHPFTFYLVVPLIFTLHRLLMFIAAGAVFVRVVVLCCRDESLLFTLRFGLCFRFRSGFGVFVCCVVMLCGCESLSCSVPALRHTLPDRLMTADGMTI